MTKCVQTVHVISGDDFAEVYFPIQCGLDSFRYIAQFPDHRTINSPLMMSPLRKLRGHSPGRAMTPSHFSAHNARIFRANRFA